MKTRKVRTQVPRGFWAALRACDQVRLGVPAVGSVRLSKRVAAALVRSRGHRLSVEAVPELGLLLLDATTS